MSQDTDAAAAAEYRRTRRRRVTDTVLVTDTMTEEVVGRLGNLSETGMLLIAQVPLVDDALYQFRFPLPDTAEDTTVELGAQLMWKNPASTIDRTWAGFRFIGAGEDQLMRLVTWLQSGGTDPA